MSSKQTRIILLAVGVGSIFLSMLADSWGYHHGQYPPVYERDWGRMLRIVGFWPTWLLIAVAVGLERQAARPGVLIALAPGLSGLAAELVKLVVRRDRPGLHDGEYVFRAFADHPFSTRDLGFPSSHVMVAFAGAAAATRLFPRAAPIWFGVAAGCGITRIQAGAHFVSDVVGGAVLGTAIGWLMATKVGFPGRPAAATGSN